MIFLFLASALIPVPGAGQDSDEQSKLHFSGRLSTRYRAQWNRDDRDHDILQYLNFDLDNLFTPKVSLHGFLRAGEDVDDRDPIFDWTNYDVQDRVYVLYLEAKEVPAHSTVHIGRQYYEGLEGVQFDGLRFMRNEAKWLSWEVFGGRYVTLYDRDLRQNTKVSGAQVTSRPFRTTSLSGEYLRLMDFPRGDDDYVNVAYRQTIGKLNLFTQYSVLNGQPKDLSARAFWLLEGGWVVSAKYFRLLHALEELSNEFDPYYPIFGPYMRFDQYNLDVTKYFGEHFSVSAGYSGRRLSDGSDESVANREFDRYCGSLSVRDVLARGLGFSTMFERWLATDDEGTYSVGGEVSYTLKKKWDVSLGTYYSKYKYDVDLVTERIDVRTWYARLKYTFKPNLHFSLRGEREDDNSPESPYGKIELRVTYEF